MPIYEYQCTVCGERSEIIRNLSDPPYTHCPQCGGEVKKLFSAPAIQFKGSGWYKTDYAAKSTAPPAKGDSAESKSETKAETKTETKSETKSEPKTDN